MGLYKAIKKGTHRGVWAPDDIETSNQEMPRDL